MDVKISVGLFLVFLIYSKRLWVTIRFCWKWIFGLVEPTLTSGFAAGWKMSS